MIDVSHELLHIYALPQPTRTTQWTNHILKRGSRKSPIVVLDRLCHFTMAVYKPKKKSYEIQGYESVYGAWNMGLFTLQELVRPKWAVHVERRRSRRCCFAYILGLILQIHNIIFSWIRHLLQIRALPHREGCRGQDRIYCVPMLHTILIFTTKSFTTIS
ncbi:hypothetical protein F5X98DRAFT_178550 [Xylaria grammica]|nr:hypothetical protein F5X98DRAFT_178550 [Xylaria grammica]